jgi:hypothetical protein
MNKQKRGLILFWIAIFWAFFWGILQSFFVDSAFFNLTMDEVNQTMWATDGIWFQMWAFGVPLAAIIAAFGILLYGGAKTLKALKYGIGIFLVVFGGLTAGIIGHVRPLFGIGGALILLSFTGILWLWAKERMAITDGPTIATDLKMVGYVFMLIAAWFICGMASQPYLKALDEVSPSSPIHVLIFLVMGWIFLFLSHYKLRKQ